MMNKRNKAFAILSLIFNILVLASSVFGLYLVFTSGSFMGKGLVLLRYFTVDSNILVGLASLILVICSIVKIAKPEKEVPTFVRSLKFMGVVSVAVTLIVSYAFLAPQQIANGGTFLSMTLGVDTFDVVDMLTASVFYLHTLTPVLAVISVIFDGNAKTKYTSVFNGFIPLAVYTVPYLVFAISPGLKLKFGGDWYGFLVFKLFDDPVINSIVLSIITVVAVFLVALVIGTVIWALSLVGTRDLTKKLRVTYEYTGEEPQPEESPVEEQSEQPQEENQQEEVAPIEEVEDEPTQESPVEEESQEETPVEEPQPEPEEVVEDEQPTENEPVEEEAPVEETQPELEESPVEEEPQEEEPTVAESVEEPVKESIQPKEPVKKENKPAKKAPAKKTAPSKKETKKAPVKKETKKTAPAKKETPKKESPKKAEPKKEVKKTNTKNTAKGGSKVAAAKKAEPAKKEAPKNETGKYNGKARVYHISQHENGYKVKLAGGERAIKTFKTQKEAIAYAKELVKTQGGSYLIHSLDGSIRKG